VISLVLRNLRYFWRTHLGVTLGAMCATAVLVGAMAVGESVRNSLRTQAENRIGRVDAALIAGDRNFRANLADRIAEPLSGVRVAPILMLQGIARNPDAESRAGIVDVFGVDDRFFGCSPAGKRDAPQAGKAFVNERLAAQLDVKSGDTVLLRIEKPSLLPRDMLMATVDDVSFALRLTVETTVGDEDFGRFSLRSSQIPPFNIFVSLPWLQKKLELPDRANLLVLGGAGPGQQAVADLIERANAAVREHWTIEDAELRTATVKGVDELTSNRVFLDDPIVDAVRGIEPGALGILTYFVNDLKKDSEATPYSTVAAIGPLTPGARVHPSVQALAQLVAKLPDNGIVLTEWLADDLKAKPSDTVALDYLVMGARLRLRDVTEEFRVARVVPISGAAADPSLMPEFPGLADSENCRDWEPGIPIDLDRLRDKDEEYWDKHRGTPKAFITLAAGQRLFGSRYGNVTAIRGPVGFAKRLKAELPRKLDPATLGLFFRDVRTSALAAGTSATDFGGLFLGLSFFLIGAALLLTSLLFVFGVEQRANEIGTLLALGFRPSRVRRLFLIESLILAVVGGALGAVLGMGYTRAVLYGLGTLWRDAIGMTTLTFHAPLGTVVLGTVIAILVAVASIALTLRKVFHRPALELLTSRNGIPSTAANGPRQGRTSLVLAVACPILAIALVVLVAGTATQAAGAFFGAGALLLIGGLALCRRLLTRFAGAGDASIHSVPSLGVRNSGRRPGRSLATIALLASGTFLVVAVQANRLEPPKDASIRESGTGGFAFFGRSTLPILRDLNSAEGRDPFNISAESMKDVAIVPLRVRDGDDASCLNLSLPQNPRLIGVNPTSLSDRGAFQFASFLPPDDAAPPSNPWQLLDFDYGSDVVPAIGDAASITWALHKKVGDTLDYTDDRGQPFHVLIVATVTNSILQGSLVVAERRMQERFASVTGYRMFLIDAPAERAKDVESTLTNAFEDIGLELTSTADRLRDFNAVQNTYLLIFQVLGGLGLLLGSLGVGMVVLRNSLERRSELALLSAVGFRSGTVRKLVWSEHGLLLGLGLSSGVVAALLAVLPGSAREVSIIPMAVVVGAVALSGVIWVAMASAFATRGPLLAALKED